MQARAPAFVRQRTMSARRGRRVALNCFHGGERFDPALFLAGRKLRSLSACLSFGGSRSAEERLRPHPRFRHRRYCFRHWHFHPHVAGERQPRVRRGAKCRYAGGGGGISPQPIRISPAWREQPKPRRSPITASTWSPQPRRPTGLIAKRRAVNSFALAGRAGGPCCSGTNGALARRHFCVTYEQLLVSTAPTTRTCAPSAPRSTSKPSLRPRDFRSALSDYQQEFDYPVFEKDSCCFFLHAAGRRCRPYAHAYAEMRRIFDALQVNEQT